MKAVLEKLYQHKTLSKEEAKNTLINIGTGEYNSSQIASFLTTFIMRNISLEEIKGFREALLELCTPVDLSEFDPMDLCGTGGDGKNTLNISTLTSFVVAGAGIPVAKHGNYGVSSISGSSNVLEYLGINFRTNEAVLQQQLSEANICFLHAPLFHPALMHVGNIRKEMGVKTFFNMLGPLVNPAKPNKQMVGVFNLELARIYQYLFQETNTSYSIIYALDGFDEISLTGDSKIFSNEGEQVVGPEYFGFSNLQYDTLAGGNSIKEATEIFMKVLRGNGTESQNQVILANAAVAIQTYKRDLNIYDCLAMAQHSLQELKALDAFNTLKKLS